MNELEWTATIVGVVGGLAGIASSIVAVLEWRKVNRKIGTLTDASRAVEVVPAWYVERMMNEDWLFGLMVADGRMICISRIVSVSDDGKWMDVELADSSTVGSKGQTLCSHRVFAVAKDRTTASVQVSSIVAAMDLQTS